MNAISRNAFASLTLLFALSAFIQLQGVGEVTASMTTDCPPAFAANVCEKSFITGSLPDGAAAQWPYFTEI